MDATETEIRNIIKLSPSKSCELDPLPTWLLKECIAELVPTITDIVNMSLRDSLMPKSLKTALSVLFWVRRFIACTPNLLVTSFSGMDCLITLMQMTYSYL